MARQLDRINGLLGGGIQVRLTIPFLLILTTTVAVLGVSSVRTSRSALGASLDKRAEILVTTLALALEDPFGMGEWDRVEQLLAGALQQDPTLLQLSVLDPSGRVKATTNGEWKHRVLEATETDRLLLAATHYMSIEDPDRRGVFEAAAPLRLADQQIGVLRVSTSTASVAEMVRRTTWIAASVALLALGAGVAIYALLTRRLTQPLSRTAQLLDAVAEGDLRHTLDLQRTDEVGRMASSLDQAVERMRAALEQVRGAADRVEGAANTITDVTSTVAAGASKQMHDVEQAANSTERVNERASGITKAAANLGDLVEDASSSMLELTASGDQMRQLAGTLSDRVDDVSSSINEMVQSVKNVRSNTESLSDAAARTSERMQAMASAMGEMAANAQEAAQLSGQVVASADTGKRKVHETVQGMESIRQATEAAEAVIRALGERTERIGSVLDVIDDVAAETNLLALNAAIIAAQAGDHGRAFSVVAGEIKKLAERVTTSTKEIGEVVRSLQAEGANAVTAIERGSASVATGVALATEAGLSLDEITNSTRRSGERIAEIVHSVVDQAEAAHQVVELMKSTSEGVLQIRQATAEQDRGNELIHRSSVDMREMAIKVRHTTEEQARGSARIRDSLEGTRAAAESIRGELQEQAVSCLEIGQFLEEVSKQAVANEAAAKSLTDATSSLQRESEALRSDVQRFRV